MRFLPVAGPMFSAECKGCDKYLRAGSSEGCDTVFADADAVESFYCQECAEKHATATDETIAVNVFFETTHG